MNEDLIKKIEIALAHHEQQIADMSEILNNQWQQIEQLKRQLSTAQDKLKLLEAGAGEGAGDSSMTVTEIALRDKPPHY